MKKLILPLIAVAMLLLSCEKEELKCYTFKVQVSYEIYCDGKLQKTDDLPLCPTTEERCGYSYQDALNFITYNSYVDLPTNYTVLYGGCPGCDGEAIVYETKVITILQ